MDLSNLIRENLNKTADNGKKAIDDAGIIKTLSEETLDAMLKENGHFSFQNDGTIK